MKRIYIVALFTLFFSGAYAQPGAYRENPFIDTLYLQKYLIVSDLIRIAMDSCISVAKKCQYVKDGIEPEVVVRQIASSDGLWNNMSFCIKTKKKENTDFLLEIYSELGITPVVCKHSGVDFVFFFSKPSIEKWFQMESIDTLIYKDHPKTYEYTYIEDVDTYDKCGSKCSYTIDGYVVLSLESDGKWYINVVDCAQVENYRVLFEKEYVKMFCVPKGHLVQNSSGFHPIVIKENKESSVNQ